jgi:hypothetical protein
MNRTRTHLLAWFVFSISSFILNESNLVHLNNSFLYSQELQSTLILKKGNNWIEIKQGDEIYIRSYNAKRKANKLPGSSLGSFTAAKQSKFVGLDLQQRILVTEFDYILLSDIHSISITSSKTMAFRFAGNNFAHGFIAGALFPLTLFLSEGGDNPMALILFAGFFGTFVGVPSAVIGLIHGLLFPNIENEFIVGQNEWIIVEE